MKPETKAFLRSVPGQLSLLGVTFLGAIALAVLTILLRDILFEPYIREKYPPADARTQEFLEKLVDGNAEIETLEKLIDREAERLAQRQGPIAEKDREARIQAHRPDAVRQVLSACYGYWMMHRDSENEDRILKALYRQYPEETADLLKRTFIVGNLEQKLLALDGVNWLNQENSDAAHRLLDYARQQAVQRRDTPILSKCDQILSDQKRE